MLKVPEELQKKYSRLLINSEIALARYGNCRKWMRCLNETPVKLFG